MIEYSYYVVVGLFGIALGAGAMWQYYRQGPEDAFNEVDTAGSGTIYEPKPVPVDDGWWDKAKRLRQRRRERRALKNGYIRWHLLSGSFSEPKYVKPEYKEGGNIPELTHDGETYLFPPDAALPDAAHGVPTYIHRKGRADPISLDHENDFAIGAKTLKEYNDLRVTSQKPGLGLGLGLGDLSTKQIMTYGILGIIGFFIIQGVLEGGVV